MLNILPLSFGACMARKTIGAIIASLSLICSILALATDFNVRAMADRAKSSSFVSYRFANFFNNFSIDCGYEMYLHNLILLVEKDITLKNIYNYTFVYLYYDRFKLKMVFQNNNIIIYMRRRQPTVVWNVFSYYYVTLAKADTCPRASA